MLRLDRASSADLDLVRELFHEYARSLGVDLGYQGFDEEVRTLPGEYASPSGVLILATAGVTAVGCVAIRPLDATTAEMKRLSFRSSWVR